MYRDSKILIIGGTGTIGNQLLEMLLIQNPQVVRIFSRDEHKQFELQQRFSDYSNIRYLIGDVRDLSRVKRAMEDVDYVFHCAAMKHVPSCEYNPFEAVQTNVIGTQNVIQAAIENQVKKVLFTSTDKAIAPTNTYGATKLTAERLISAAQMQIGSKETIFSAVRFGNVMGSRGSVIPLFRDQIISKSAITLTDPTMERYMMTPKQAVSLMLEANQCSMGGEVFVLKMPIIKLIDLAHSVIEIVSEKYAIHHPVNILNTGLRPGEKMYEELMTETEKLDCIEYDSMYIIPPYFQKGYKPVKRPEELHSTVYSDVDINKPISKSVLKSWLIEQQIL